MYTHTHTHARTHTHTHTHTHYPSAKLLLGAHVATRIFKKKQKRKNASRRKKKKTPPAKLLFGAHVATRILPAASRIFAPQNRTAFSCGFDPQNRMTRQPPTLRRV